MIDQKNNTTKDRERLAQTFLKPLATRYRLFLGIADTILRPMALHFPARSSAESGSSENILIFDPGLLGDMMMLVPFLQNLAAYYPKSRICLFGRPGVADTLLAKGLIHELLPVSIPWGHQASRWKRNNPLSFNWLRFFKNVYGLRNRHFDLGFASGWGGDLRGNFVLWLAGVNKRVGYGYAGGKYFLSDIATPDLGRPHVVDRNLQLLSHLGIPVVPFHEALPLAENVEESVKGLLTQHGISSQDLIIGIHPGAGAKIREWGDERFAEVANRLTSRFGAKVIWFVDPHKPKPLPKGLNVVPLSLSLSELEAVLSNCKLFICNDSGPMHLAAALKVPVVAIFGAQRPEWFGPWGEGHRVVIRNDVWCRPCADNCIFDEPHCLRLISVDQVMNQAEQALKNLTPSYRAATTVL